MNDKIAYTIPEAVELTGVSRSHIYTQLTNGSIQAVKVGKRTLIKKEELEKWINSLPVWSKETLWVPPSQRT